MASGTHNNLLLCFEFVWRKKSKVVQVDVESARESDKLFVEEEESRSKVNQSQGQVHARTNTNTVETAASEGTIKLDFGKFPYCIYLAIVCTYICTYLLSTLSLI
jgi:hypothetical protein